MFEGLLTVWIVVINSRIYDEYWCTLIWFWFLWICMCWLVTVAAAHEVFLFQFIFFFRSNHNLCLLLEWFTTSAANKLSIQALSSFFHLKGGFKRRAWYVRGRGKMWKHKSSSNGEYSVLRKSIDRNSAIAGLNWPHPEFPNDEVESIVVKGQKSGRSEPMAQLAFDLGRHGGGW